jgi:hypothetical protein
MDLHSKDFWLPEAVVRIDIKAQNHLREYDSSCKIAEVFTNNSDNKIGIQLTDGTSITNIISWDIEKNKEVNSMEVDKNSQIIFDDIGEIYTVNENIMNLVERQVRLSCFQVDF